MVGTHSPHGARGTYICSQSRHINMRVRQPEKVVVSCIGLLLCILDLVTSTFLALGPLSTIIAHNGSN